ncbi:MAG: outer membrane protein assembly factor BamA [Flavobacteriales bacterium]|nr:outer membrane protein assembly factor BamA [Flavobacteriales bacterium]MCB9204484.1 outer membrane protein assembly factor BamA [Flavobacteriales bacterium]
MPKYFQFLLLVVVALFVQSTSAQGQITVGTEKLDYSSPKQYEVGGITVTGTRYLDKKVLILLSGLSQGETIQVPGEAITEAIRKLWDQGLFSDIDIRATRIEDGKIYLDIKLQERPRLSKYAFKGVKKGDANDIRESIPLIKGKVVTDNIIVSTENIIKNHYIDKGFLNVEVNTVMEKDSTLPNSVILKFNVDRKKKVKIGRIIFRGNEEVKKGKLARSMKETKQRRWWRVWKTSKFLDYEYENDKKAMIAKYNQLGYRDARIISDTIYSNRDGSINVEINLEEGRKYYFRNITWAGNTKYSSETLGKLLGIKKGDIYDQARLEANLFMNPNGRDVSSLYLDDGYLFFNVEPVEILVVNDSIDLEMRIREGKQATINKVTVVGNTKTNDHVILREIRTKPGQLFSRADIIRSQRELSQLGYFNAETLGVEPKPNPVDGTVDIEYTVEEKPSDQIELSGGWGAGRIVGTLGVSFNNFSLRNMFKKGAWRPLPAGDGQRLSLRAQSNGLFFQSYNFSFMEPWLGGNKPNAFSISAYHSVQSNGIQRGEANRESIKITGVSVGLGSRLKWPDDFFSMQHELNYQNYILENYPLIAGFNNGNSHTVSYRFTLSRNSIGDPIFPTYGAILTGSVELTPPFAAMTGLDVNNAQPSEKYQLIEYHKWKFDAKWYISLAKNLVIETKMQFGFLGFYNKDLGAAPFERFYVGGDGLSGFGLDGREIIALRGYDNNSLTPAINGSQVGGTIFTKYGAEVRYRVSPNPQATVYILAFAEAGNSYLKFSDYKPFQLRKSAGVGVRIFLPMFGLLGLDYGWRFDDVPGYPNMAPGQFHFSIGQQF